MATAEVQEIRATSYVGFDSITQQIEHKLLKRGFQFNVIVVGTSPFFHCPVSSKPATLC
jgi:septin 3/9/12